MSENDNNTPKFELSSDAVEYFMLAELRENLKDPDTATASLFPRPIIADEFEDLKKQYPDATDKRQVEQAINSENLISDEKWKELLDYDPDRWIEFADYFSVYGEQSYGFITLVEACDFHWLEIITYILERKRKEIDLEQTKELFEIVVDSQSNDPEDEGSEEFISQCKEVLFRGLGKD